MRNISFALTTQQVIDGSKTVTRRMGWLRLRVGDLLLPVRKCMGLRQGEKVQALRGPIRVVSVRREPLLAMIADPIYGFDECVLEGFGQHPEYRYPVPFVDMFCATHKGCVPSSEVTRIEFTYAQAYEFDLTARLAEIARTGKIPPSYRQPRTYVIALNNRQARSYANNVGLKRWSYLGKPESCRGLSEGECILYGNYWERRDWPEFEIQLKRTHLNVTIAKESN